MEILPDFSNSKIEIRSRIEGAIREKKKRPNIYQYSVFFCFMLFTTTCTAFFLKNILFINQRSGNDIDYYSLEQLLKSDLLDTTTTIEIPQNLSFISASESDLILNTDFYKGSYE